MMTYVQLSAKLLRDAAKFFRHVGVQNPNLKEEMDRNAFFYEQVAEHLEHDPTGVLDAGEDVTPVKA